MKQSKLAIFGGKKTRTKSFVNQWLFDHRERKAVISVLKSNELSGFLAFKGEKFFGGKKVLELEKSFEKHYKIKHALAIQSATAGLHAAIAACDLEPGDEVICTPYSMIASATAAVMHNAIPVFADIDPTNFNICPKSFKKLINKRTKAIIVVHLFGYPADMDKIMKIAKERNIFVIEDCAQAPDALYKNRFVGTIGDIGVFSFNQNKTITCGEGGIVTTNNNELAKRIELIRNHGEVVVDKYPVKSISGIIGYNYRMTEIEAAIALEQFKKLKKLNNHRIRLAKYLTKKLKKFGDLFELPATGCDYCFNKCKSKHVYFVYPFKYNSKVLNVSRDKFAKALQAEGFPVTIGYLRPIYLEPMYRQLKAYGKKGFPFKGPHISKKIEYKKGIAPVCERMHFKELLFTNICRYPLNETDIDGFVQAVEKIIKNVHEIKKRK